jgi:two-component system nitrate/nitrite response regulator NarL
VANLIFRDNSFRERFMTSQAFQRLTAREQLIALLVADGLSNKGIARQIDVAEGTIRMHLHNIYVKLDIANRVALTRLAIEYRYSPNLSELGPALSDVAARDA